MKVEKRRLAPGFLLSTLAFLLLSCGGSPHPRVIRDTGATSVPPTIELYSEVRVATLHFPPGTYSLHAVDKIGYYYNVPRGIIEHTAGGVYPRSGGIFVSKRNRTKLRGYVYLGGSVTHVGNLSHARYEFRN